MMTNYQFERAAARRRATALWIALALHLAAFAAIAYRSELRSHLPDFVQKWFPKEASAVSEPQANALP